MSLFVASRPPTPESPLTSSLYHATTTIDDLTAAIEDFSRIPSPEPSATLTCCCGRADCEYLSSWLALKSKLNQRLVLSAEVGQALLQRHEAYVRQSERRLHNNDHQYSESREINGLQSSTEGLQLELDELAKEKAQLEKRLNHALVNTEVTEVSNKTILQELQEARETISRLTSHHARSVGWETRLSVATKERDDMQQERDGETHRARLAESRFAALKEKTAKLQSEVRRLQENLEQKRQHRMESSEHIIQDARSRLETFRNSHLGLTAKVAEDELTSVLESLVHDNEVLKHDNAELQHLLAESREEIHVLQEEVEEQRVNAPSRPSLSGANTPHSRHFHTGSVPSVNLKDFTMFSPKGRRNASAEGRARHRSGQASISIRMSPAAPEPQTPDFLRSPNSTNDSLAASEPKWTSLGQTSPAASHVSFEIDEEAETEGSPTLFEKPRGHKPLLLLTRSRGIQTESLPSGVQSPSPFPSHISSISPQDPRSESSSFSESQSTHIAAILERVVTLLNRITQADALTLTNRLKRQHLKGADVGHLSRSTVSNILAEATGLRAQFRFLLEDEKVVTTCTRKDLRLLFKIVKDVFTELGQMRVTLNEVVLDPASAPKISELALNPGKAEAEKKEREAAAQGAAAGWMAPISKLFSPTGRSDSTGPGDRLLGVTGNKASVGSNPVRPPPRFAPKLGPALAASATTVNVEFSGSGVGRAVTSTLRAQPTSTITLGESATVTDLSSAIAAGTPSSSAGLMGIFAGAPKAIEPSDPWVVLPSSSPAGLRRKQSTTRNNLSPDIDGPSTATIGRSLMRKNMHRLSRNVDAVIDVDRPQAMGDEDEADFLPPLLERTLRRRGLSDSSIHSTFTNHGDDDPGMPPSPHKATSPATAPPSRMAAWPFQALSRTVFNFRQSAAGTIPVVTSGLSHEIVDSGEASRSSRGSSVHARRTASTADADDSPNTLTATSPVDATPTELGSQTQTPTRRVVQPKPLRVASPSRGVLPALTSWAANNIVIDPISGSDPFIASSLRDESFMQRTSARSRLGPKDESHARDFY